MTPTPDTSPEAVEAMIERLEKFAESFDGWDGNPDRARFLREAAAMLREVASERDARTIGEDVAFNQRNMALDALKAAEAERDEWRDEWREKYNALADSALKHVGELGRDNGRKDVEIDAARASQKAAEAEAAALREALTLAANRLERMLVDLIASGSPLRWEASDWVDAARKAALKENHDGL